MRKLFAAALVAIACWSPFSLAQTVTQPAPIWYGPPGAPWVTIAGTAQLVSGSAMTPIGAVVTLPPMVDPASSLPVTVFDLSFPALASQTIVSGVQVTIQPSGGGLVFRPQVLIYPITLTVPAGSSVTVHYDASISGGSVTMNAIAPPTPPAPTVTADGMKMPPATQLVDASGAKWTVGAICGTDGAAGQVSVFRNGVRQFCSIDFATIKGGVVYVSDFGSGPGWQRWSGSAFVSAPAPF